MPVNTIEWPIVVATITQLKFMEIWTKGLDFSKKMGITKQKHTKG